MTIGNFMDTCLDFCNINIWDDKCKYYIYEGNNDEITSELLDLEIVTWNITVENPSRENVPVICFNVNRIKGVNYERDDL